MPLRRAQLLRRCRLFLASAALAGLLAGGTLPAQVPDPAPAPSEREIQNAIAQLADPRYPVRQRATRFLWSAGDVALPALKLASTHPDPEISRRARDILADLHLGISPDLPRAIAEEARRYRRSRDEQVKRAAVEALAEMGPESYGALARLCELEDDAELRSELFSGLIPDVLAVVKDLIVEEKYDDAENALLLTIADGAPDAARLYAAFAHARGNIDAAIVHFQQRAARKQAEAHVVLAFLHRASGDLKSALASAQKAPRDQTLAELLMLELGDDRALARRVSRQIRQAGEGDAGQYRLGLLAALQRQSGNLAGAEKTLDRLTSAMAGDPDRTDYLARMLLLNERTKQAIDLHIKAGSRVTAFSLLCLRQEFGRALKLAESTIEEGHEEALPLRLMLARTRHDLGQTQQAKQAFDALAVQAVKEQDLGLVLTVISSEIESGLWENAFAHGEAYLDRPEPVGDDEAESVAQVLFARAGDGGGDAAWWWKILSERSGRNKQSLRTLRAIMDGALPEADLKQLADAGVRESRRRDPETRSARLAVIARTLQKRGVTTEALEVMRINAGLSTDSEALLDLAAHHAKAGQWKPAAEQYQHAAERDPTDPVARFLWGAALSQHGDVQRGEQLMQQANALVMGEDSERWQLIQALKQLGLDAPAEAQRDAIRRTGWFHGPESGAVLRESARKAWDAGDAATAARLWERFLLTNIHSDMGWVEERGALFIPALVHRIRARAMAQEGKSDAAVAEVRLALSIMPGDVEAVIGIDRELRNQNQAALADPIFTDVMSHQRALLKEYPDSPLIHNSVAWILTRTGRDLPAALAHAQKAADLAPRNTSILDTLAEAHFQLDQRAKAIEIIQRCIDLEPANPRHQLARQRFESGQRESEPPEEQWL